MISDMPCHWSITPLVTFDWLPVSALVTLSIGATTVELQAIKVNRTTILKKNFVEHL